ASSNRFRERSSRGSSSSSSVAGRSALQSFKLSPFGRRSLPVQANLSSQPDTVILLVSKQDRPSHSKGPAMNSSQQTITESSRWTRAEWWMLTVSCLAVALVVAAMAALYSALPQIAVETGATQAQLTWIVDGYTLVLACLVLPAGAI